MKRIKSLDFILSSMTHIKFPWLEQVYMLILTLLAHQVRHFQLKTFLLKVLLQQKTIHHIMIMNLKKNMCHDIPLWKGEIKKIQINKKN